MDGVIKDRATTGWLPQFSKRCLAVDLKYTLSPG
jgi:hypothetical protein